jgi:hypothetical protein
MKGEPLTLADIEQWVDNDESLYDWWRRSRQGKRAFVRENRAELTRAIVAVRDAPPREKTWRDVS